MPGPAMHHMIAEELKNRISAKRRSQSKINLYQEALKNNQLKTLFRNPANLPYYYLGCQGPDFLFFNTKDWPGGLSLADELVKINEKLEEFEKNIEAAIPPQITSTLESLEDLNIPVVKETIKVTRNFLDQLMNLMNTISLTNLEFIKSIALKGFLFEKPILTHPYRDGENDTENWWWFDILHYRKTGEFAKKLLDNTKDDLNSPLHLYALGYLTHYAADTVGHPYVNMISGGPYRSHAQRHKVGENFQDVYNFNGDFTSSSLHAYYNFNFTGIIDTRDDDEEDHLPYPESNMPDDLASLILKTLKDVYAPNREFEIGKKNFGETNIKQAYWGYYKYLKSSTTLGIKLPPPKSYSLSEDLVNLWEDAKSRIGDIGDTFNNDINFDGEFSIINVIETLSEIVAASWALALAFLQVLVESIKDVIEIAGNVLCSAIESLYELIYDIFQNLRLIVALNGFAFPMGNHKNHPAFSQFIKPENNDSLHTNCRDIIDKLPFQKVDDYFNLSKHLKYPSAFSNKEIPTTSSNPLNMYLDKTSIHYAKGIGIETDANINILLETLMNFQNGTNPTDINGDEIIDDQMAFQEIFKDKKLGNAIQLTKVCYQKVLVGDDIPDFNLDGDRGYGYLCWKKIGGDENKPDELEKNNLNIEVI